MFDELVVFFFRNFLISWFVDFFMTVTFLLFLASFWVLLLLERLPRPPPFFDHMHIGMYVHTYAMCMVGNAFTWSLITENGWDLF